MKCPRCNRDTALMRMKVNRDGTDAFLCSDCGRDWTSIATHFGRNWWSTHRPNAARENHYHGLFGLFLNNNMKGGDKKTMCRRFAKTAVGCLSSDLDAYQTCALELEQEVVTRADYGWLAGLYDTLGDFPAERPGIPVSDRVCELIGSGACRSQYSAIHQIEPYLKCERARVQVDHDIRNGDYLTKAERVNPSARDRCFKHPDDVTETETSYAWFAGVFDICGDVDREKSGLKISVKTSCVWRAAAFEAVFGGTRPRASGRHMWICGKEGIDKFLKNVGPHVVGKNGMLLAEAFHALEGSDALSSRSKVIYNRKLRRHVSLDSPPRYGGEEDREGNGKTAQPERLPPTRPNVAGLKSPGRDAKLVLDGHDIHPRKSGESHEAPPTLPVNGGAVIRLSSSMRKKLAEKAKKCFLCRKILETNGDHILKGTKDMPLLARARHIILETGKKITVPCSVCGKETSAHEYNAHDMSACPRCEKVS